MSEVPVFELVKCNGCGLCLGVCSRGGFTLKGGCVCLDDCAECDDCRECELVCPTGAIYFPFEVTEES